MSEALDPEDAKLVTLARSARARNGTAEGAAVRDDTGRTYVATSVALPSLSLTAVQAAVVMAVASGAASLEAVAVVSEAVEVAGSDRVVATEVGGTPVFVLAGYDGVVRSR
jgi:cytidine deaminase